MDWPSLGKEFQSGEQGWRSGERKTRLPPMWPGFDSPTQCLMWAEFACSERFFSGYSGLPLSQNPTFLSHGPTTLQL